MTTEEREEMEDLHIKLQEQVDRMRQFLDENEGENGELSEDALENYKKMDKVKVALQSKITRRKAIIEAREQTTASVNGHKLEDVLNYPQSFNAGIGIKGDRASDAYRKAAIEAIKTKFHVIRNDLATNPDSAGGYLIPAEWDTRLIQTLEEENIMRTLSTTIKTSGEHRIPIVATKPVASWTAEGQAAQSPIADIPSPPTPTLMPLFLPFSLDSFSSFVKGRFFSALFFFLLGGIFYGFR